MKDECEECGYEPEVDEAAGITLDLDLAECEGCKRTICVNDCAFDSSCDDGVELYWCCDCVEAKNKEEDKK